MDILYLPSSLEIHSKEYAINADFRPCISIMQIFERADLTDSEKIQAMVGILFIEDIPERLMEEAAMKAVWFLNCGEETHEEGKTADQYGRLFSWNQDLRYIISAVDRASGGSVRARDFFHWWDFVSCFMESGECTFGTIVHQRKLKKQGKQTKADRQWWMENRDIAELRTEKQLSLAERAAVAEFYRLLNGGERTGDNRI